MSNEWFKKHEKDVFIKFSESELTKNLMDFYYGKSSLSKVSKHFFNEIMFKCVAQTRGKNSKYPETPYDALNDDAFMETVFAFMRKHPTLFEGIETVKDGDELMNGKLEFYIRKFFAFSFPRTVSQFHAKNVTNVIRKFYPEHMLFDEPLNYHDASCGFGMRLCGALMNNFNYYGTDPNKELNVKLNELYNLIKKYHLSNAEAEMRCQGSEIFIPEWENKMDLSFTSPPYFNLEKYSDDDSSSTKNYDNYDRWIEEFSKPTLSNTVKYLKSGGYLCINIKNMKKYNVFDDYVTILDSYDELEKQDFIDLEMYQGKHFTIKAQDEKLYNLDTYKEKIMVFKKC